MTSPGAAHFIVALEGEVTIVPDAPAAPPAVGDEDRRRARLLAEGGNFNKESEDLFAEGIAVARAGGDVEAFIRERLTRP